MCNYCGCENLQVIGRYMAEHVAIINAAGDLERAVAAGDLALIAHRCTDLADLLHPHTQSEEVGLFAVMRRDDDFRPTVESLRREHLTLDEQLDAIAAGRTDFLPGFIGDLRDHIDREENGLFPAAAVSLTADEWDELIAREPHPPSQPDPGTAGHPRDGHEHPPGKHEHPHGAGDIAAATTR